MDLKAKQDYLFVEILEANYDPQIFQEFMERQKGVNLDNYSMEQLKQVVQQFKGNQKAEKDEHQQPLQPSPKLESPQIPVSQQKEQQVRVQGKKGESFNTSTKIYHQFLRKEELPALYRRVHQQGQAVSVKIRSYSKENDESLFGGTYVAYLLQTGVWNVRRRFKDFQWLHSKLGHMYPGLPVPPIPKKTALRSFEDRHLQDRMICFERFTNRLLQIPQICSDPILEEFLSVGSQQEWANCKDRYEIRLNSQGSKILSLKGDALLNTSEFAVDPADTQSLASSLEISRNINSILSSFQKALRLATERAFELSATLGQAYKQLQKAGSRGSQVVELMGEFINELGYRMQKECFFVKENLQDYWAYEQKYQQNLLAAIARANKDHLELLNKAKHLSQQQQQIDIGDSPKNRPLAEYLAAKEQYRIRLSFTLEQLRRYRREDLGVVAKQWSNALGQYVGGIKQLILSGADQLTKAMCVCQGKKLREVEYLTARQRQKESIIVSKQVQH